MKRVSLEISKITPFPVRIMSWIYRNYMRDKKFEYFREENILIEPYMAIYFPIPKSASSTLKKYISHILEVKGDPKFYGEYPEYYHSRNFPYVRKEDIYGKYINYFRFTFVRNPYERVVSCYEDWVNQEDIKKSFKIYGLFYPKMPFKEFVKGISKIPDEIPDGHFRSQYSYLTDKKGNLLIDFAGKVENLDKDFEKICRFSRLPYKKLLQENQKTKKNYMDYYDEETKKIVQKRYKKDFETFGYERGAKC